MAAEVVAATAVLEVVAVEAAAAHWKICQKNSFQACERCSISWTKREPVL